MPDKTSLFYTPERDRILYNSQSTDGQIELERGPTGSPSVLIGKRRCANSLQSFGLKA